MGAAAQLLDAAEAARDICSAADKVQEKLRRARKIIDAELARLEDHASVLDSFPALGTLVSSCLGNGRPEPPVEECRYSAIAATVLWLD